MKNYLKKCLLVGRSSKISNILNKSVYNKGIHYESCNLSNIWYFSLKGKLSLFAKDQLIDTYDIILPAYESINVIISGYFKNKKDSKTVILNSRNKCFSVEKQIQYLFLSAFEIPHPTTFYLDKHDRLNKFLDSNDICFPIIVKGIITQKGDDNFKFESIDAYNKFFENNNIRKYVIQNFIPNMHDYRVYISNDKYSVSKRTRSDNTTHLNNSAKGGIESIEYNLDYKIILDCLKIYKLLKLDLVGIDLVVDQTTGKHYILELNINNPGITLNENLTSELETFALSMNKFL